MFLFLFLVQNPFFFFQYTNGKHYGFENFSIVAQSILKSVKNWSSEKNIIWNNEHASAHVDIVNSLLYQLLKQKVLGLKKSGQIFQKGQSFIQFWDCIVLLSAFHIAL